MRFCRNDKDAYDRNSKQPVSDKQRPFRIKSENKGRDNKTGLNDVDNKNSLCVKEAETHEAMMEVFFVRWEGRAPVGQAI